MHSCWAAVPPHIQKEGRRGRGKTEKRKRWRPSDTGGGGGRRHHLAKHITHAIGLRQTAPAAAAHASLTALPRQVQGCSGSRAAPASSANRKDDGVPSAQPGAAGHHRTGAAGAAGPPHTCLLPRPDLQVSKGTCDRAAARAGASSEEGGGGRMGKSARLRGADLSRATQRHAFTHHLTVTRPGAGGPAGGGCRTEACLAAAPLNLVELNGVGGCPGGMPAATRAGRDGGSGVSVCWGRALQALLQSRFRGDLGTKSLHAGADTLPRTDSGCSAERQGKGPRRQGTGCRGQKPEWDPTQSHATRHTDKLQAASCSRACRPDKGGHACCARQCCRLQAVPRLGCPSPGPACFSGARAACLLPPGGLPHNTYCLYRASAPPAHSPARSYLRGHGAACTVRGLHARSRGCMQGCDYRPGQLVGQEGGLRL